MAAKKAQVLPVGGMTKGDEWTKQVGIPTLRSDQTADYERLKSALKIEQQARDDGARSLPNKDDRDLNETQRRVCEEIFRGIALLHQFLAEQLGRAAQLSTGLRPPRLDEDLERARIEQTVAKALNEHRSELIELKEAELESRLDLRYFRANNKLQRAAVYRASPHGLASLLVLLALVESGFNGLLLRKISDEGWVGGIFIALLISAVNLILGIAGGGFGWRLVGHVRTPPKLLGGAIAVVCLSGAVIWNIYIAHFREVAELAAARAVNVGTLPQTALDAWRHVHSEGIFGLHTMYSWALLALGLGAHLLVSKEAWDHIADRYYDYRKVDHRHQLAREGFTAAMMEVEEGARDAVQAALAELESVSSQSESAAQKARYINELATQRHGEVLDSESEWVRQGESLLRAYREENLKVRHEGTAPAYFETYPNLQDYRAGRFGDTATRSEMRGSLQMVEARLETIGGQIRLADEALRDNSAVLKRLRLHAERMVTHLGEGLRAIEADVLKIADSAVSERRGAPADSNAPTNAA